MSHDIEDIVLLVDGRPEIVEEIQGADIGIKEYLVNEFKKLLEDQYFLESISGTCFLMKPARAVNRLFLAG